MAPEKKKGNETMRRGNCRASRREQIYELELTWRAAFAGLGLVLVLVWLVAGWCGGIGQWRPKTGGAKKK